MKATIKRMTEPGIHGYRVECGERHAEAIRCYSGQWAVWCYDRGDVRDVRGEVPEHLGTRYVSYVAALRLAAEWVLGGAR